MGFVGQNGAGKTTTLRLILNMAKRESGDITILGFDAIKDELPIKNRIAVVFDDIFFVDSWTLAQVEKAIKGFYETRDSNAYHNYLKKWDLAENKKVSELSRGMKMKLSLAVSFSHDTELLILDEPTSGLDPVARDEILGIFKEYVKDGKKSILFSTHITSDLEKVADSITLIHHGQIYYSGDMQNFAHKHGDKSIDDILVSITKP